MRECLPNPADHICKACTGERLVDPSRPLDHEATDSSRGRRGVQYVTKKPAHMEGIHEKKCPPCVQHRGPPSVFLHLNHAAVCRCILKRSETSSQNTRNTTDGVMNHDGPLNGESFFRLTLGHFYWHHHHTPGTDLCTRGILLVEKPPRNQTPRASSSGLSPLSYRDSSASESLQSN